jgi:hypothetical protein
MLSSTLIRTTQLPSGQAVPVLAQATWGFAEGKHERDQEISALRLGLELGWIARFRRVLGSGCLKCCSGFRKGNVAMSAARFFR